MNPLTELGADECAALQRNPLWRMLDAEAQALLGSRLQLLRQPFGDVLVREGEPADAYYILLRGRARVLREHQGEELDLGRLLPGDGFGESALREGGVRNASVRASTEVSLVRLWRHDFLALAETHPALRQAIERMSRAREMSAFVQAFSDFGRLPAACLQALIDAFESQAFSAGERLIEAGTPGAAMYVLRQGRAYAWREQAGHRVPLAWYRAGDWFGERALLSGETRAAHVEAVEAGEALRLDAAAVTQLRERFPAFDQLLQARQARYLEVPPRMALDFAEELLPPEARREAEVVAETAPAARPGAAIRRFPWIEQIDEMDCGPACLAMLARHHGLRVSRSELRERCQVDRDGSSLRALVHAGATIGLVGRQLKLSKRHLDDLPLPAICHFDAHHFVVLYRLDARHAWIADPAHGKTRLSRAEFESRFTGYVACFEVEARTLEGAAPSSILAQLWPLLAPYRGSLALAIGLALLVSVLSLLFPVATQFVIDQVIVSGDLDLLHAVLLALLAALLSLQFGQWIQQYLLAHLTLVFDSAALDLLTRRLLALPMRYFHSRRTGDLVRRLDGARQLRQFVVQQGIGGALALLQLLAASLLMLAYSRTLGVVFLCSLPLFLGLMLVARRLLRPLYRQLEEARARHASRQIDAIRGIEAIKAAAAESSFRERMLDEFLSVSRQQLRSNFLTMAYDGSLQVLSYGVGIVLLWLGAQAVIAGSLSVGTLVAFNGLLALAVGSLQRALGAYDEWQFMAVQLERMREVFDSEPEQGHARQQLCAVHALSGQIRVEQLGFRYAGEDAPPILDRIDLQFEPGRRYALVGRSGSGKTTLVKLLAGLMPPSTGRILFDQQDATTLDHRQLRRHIGFVLQDNPIFDASVLANIACGEAEPDFDRALRAAQLAQAHEFIARLPLGYQTRIGESGLQLSGGQRQRIAIARALYRNPPILIFDEATSALDGESERAIQASMDELAPGRTLIIIAHRLSTIRSADEIVVLDQGRVVERGSHDSLQARGGLYAHLAAQQWSSAG